jgi:hypothetical protein
LTQSTLLSELNSSDLFAEHGSLILNLWDKINEKTYLELGVRDNKNFNQIQALSKFSVDTNGAATFTGTTDEYFATISEDTRFDVIFIDANHDYQYVINDLINSSKHCNEWVLLHDCVPPNETFTNTKLCSDSFRVLYYLITRKNIELYVMNNNFGLTLVRMPSVIEFPEESYANTSYEEFVRVLNTVKRFSASEIVDILNN